MSHTIKIEVSDTATPVLAHLHRELTDRTGLNEYIGAAASAGTRMHIRSAAATRNETASKLNASPTGYLTKRADLVSHATDREGVTLNITGAIFKRVFGPVTVRPVSKKYLTIPWRAEAYGKRAGEFSGLFVFVSGRGRAFLAKREGKKLLFYFLLKSFVVLPQDRGLLPSDQQYAQGAELGARGYLKKELRLAA